MKDFEDNSFDGVYCLEATCHAKDPTIPYKEIFRVMKPGAQFVESAWALTDNFDPDNQEHVKVMDAIAVRVHDNNYIVIVYTCIQYALVLV